MQNLSAIVVLDCSYNNISSLNVNTMSNTILTLKGDNNNIRYFNAASFPNITSLNLAYNKLSSFSVTDNHISLLLGNNQLSAINNDIGFGYSVVTLDLNTNSISSLDVSNLVALDNINLNSNYLTAIDSQSLNPTLNIFQINNNNLKFLDTSLLFTLKFLDCSYNSISSLNLINNEELEFLYCNNNALSSITSLSRSLCALVCGSNPLTFLNLQHLTSLNTLDFSNSNLSSVSISGLAALYYLNCSNNTLSANTLNTILTTLCTFNYSTSLSGVVFANNNAETRTTASDAAFNALTALGWTLVFD
jgi:Leucine-rich repeat (LRR) protein